MNTKDLAMKIATFASDKKANDILLEQNTQQNNKTATIHLKSFLLFFMVPPKNFCTTYIFPTLIIYEIYKKKRHSFLPCLKELI